MKTAKQIRARRSSNRFQRLADRVIRDDSTQGYADLNFRLGNGAETRPFAQSACASVCMNCPLPACIRDYDYKAEMKAIGLHSGRVWCPIYLCAEVGQWENGEVLLPLDRCRAVVVSGMADKIKPKNLIERANGLAERILNDKAV